MLVGTGMLELLGWRALVREVSYAWQKHAFKARITANEDKTNRQGTYFSPVGVPETEVFLELGREVLILRLGSCNI